MIDKINIDAEYYEVNGLSIYSGKIKGEIINTWMELMKKLHPKDEGNLYTILDYSFAHGNTITDISPPDSEMIGEYIWINGAWKTIAKVEVKQEDTYEIAFARSEAFRTLADPLKLKIEEAAIRAGTTPDYTEWLEMKDHIRSLFPKPIKPE